MSADYELAQVNIGRILAPFDSEAMYGFTSKLEEVNAVADGAEGFVWRLVDEGGADATDFRVFGDEWLAVNLSVWTSPEALHAYVFGPEHRAMLKRRREWFAHLAEAYSAMWWVPAGHRPALPEAEKRLTILREKGPTAEAFTMKESFPEPA
ncbi:DUF3291 domain-containing protein [Glycomyces algeriensis]|uniref:DUF3291 domain-containing protein n=1 Tax=Glycomyces algeriensis TaxID=256037 RepID=A0A9W6G9B2_9ACTN|nr:DUF3291 domain-containing protein [Glycomyces algeriensis]MDA1365031.1 DUF3291 domain-containing protein [Glycomyces algeriensis]MDR7349908.1 hypothetical protein [Glycomyces algeriensis]GLI42618.1 hypothetical protein GALLR39Z86_24680 [Glycomyces algeriensis]